MTDAEFAADRALCDAALPGPYQVEHGLGGPEIITPDRPQGLMGTQDDATWQMMAAARTRWPTALAEIEKLHVRIAELEATLG